MAEHAFQVAPDQDHEYQIGDRIEIHFADLVRRHRDVGGIGIGHAQADRDRQIHGQAPNAQTADRAAIKRITRIQQGRGGQCETHPVEELAELVFIRTAVKRDGNPDHVHHRKAGEDQAEEHAAIGFFDHAFSAFRIVRNGRVADPGKGTDKVREFVAPAVPAQVNALCGQIDIGRLNPGFALQRALDQPHTGWTSGCLPQAGEYRAGRRSG